MKRRLRPHLLDHSALSVRDLIGAQTHIGLDADTNLSAAISTASRRNGATPVAFRWDLQMRTGHKKQMPCRFTAVNSDIWMISAANATTRLRVTI